MKLEPQTNLIGAFNDFFNFHHRGDDEKFDGTAYLFRWVGSSTTNSTTNEEYLGNRSQKLVALGGVFVDSPEVLFVDVEAENRLDLSLRGEN